MSAAMLLMDALASIGCPGRRAKYTPCVLIGARGVPGADVQGGRLHLACVHLGSPRNSGSKTVTAPRPFRLLCANMSRKWGAPMALARCAARTGILERKIC
jgi:hypothetical protein